MIKKLMIKKPPGLEEGGYGKKKIQDYEKISCRNFHVKHFFTNSYWRQAMDAKPQLIRCRDLAAMLKVSKRSIWRMKTSKKLPRSIEFGGSTRWLLSDITAWLALGCPSQRQFEAFKAAQRKRR